MGFLDIFKKKEVEPPLKKEVSMPIVPRAGATLYPDKIIIDTVDSLTVGYGLTSTTNFSILPVDSNNELLGAKIKSHLNLSLMNQPIPADFKENTKSWLKARGFKTGKSQYIMAKHLSISLKDSQLTISASINGGPTGKTEVLDI